MSATASPRAPVSATSAGSGVIYNNAPAAIAAAEAALASAAAAADASGTRRRRERGAASAVGVGAGAAVAAADAADRKCGGEKGGGGGGAVVEAMRRIATAASAAQSVYARVCPTARQPYYFERFAVASNNLTSSTSPAPPMPPAYSYSTPSWSPPARYIQLVRSLRRGVEAIQDHTKHHTNTQRERSDSVVARDEVRETTNVVLGLLKQRTDDAAILYPLLSLCSGLADDDHSFGAVPLLASRAALLANVILVQVRRGGGEEK